MKIEVWQITIYYHPSLSLSFPQHRNQQQVEMIEISDFQFRWLCQLRLGSRDCLGVAILPQLKFIERIYKGNYINVLCERAQWGFWYMSTDFICQHYSCQGWLRSNLLHHQIQVFRFFMFCSSQFNTDILIFPWVNKGKKL